MATAGTLALNDVTNMRCLGYGSIFGSADVAIFSPGNSCEEESELNPDQ